MTVNTNSITDGPYTGNGVTDDFAYNFRVEADTQLKVFLTPVGGVATLQTLTTDYTVTGVGNDLGGDVAFVTPPATNEIVFIRSNYPFTQLTNFSSQGAFFPVIHEASFDQLTFLSQQIGDLLARKLGFDESYSGALNPTLPDPVSGKFLQWKSDLSGFINASGTSAPSALSVVLGEGNSTSGTDLVVTAGDEITTDTIDETTPAAGVTVDGVKLKDSQVYTDTINEKTAAAGILVDGVKCKDSNATANIFYASNGTAALPSISFSLDGTMGMYRVSANLLGWSINATQKMTLNASGLNLLDNELKRPSLIDYREKVNIIGSVGGGSQTINMELGNIVSATIDTSATTFVFTNPPATGFAGGFVLWITNGESQGAITWPSSVDWANGGTQPVLSAAGVDKLVFETIDGGTTYTGDVAGLDYA